MLPCRSESWELKNDFQGDRSHRIAMPVAKEVEESYKKKIDPALEVDGVALVRCVWERTEAVGEEHGAIRRQSGNAINPNQPKIIIAENRVF